MKRPTPKPPAAEPATGDAEAGEDDVEINESLDTMTNTFIEEQEEEDADVTDIIGGDIENEEKISGANRPHAAIRAQPRALTADHQLPFRDWGHNSSWESARTACRRFGVRSRLAPPPSTAKAKRRSKPPKPASRS